MEFWKAERPDSVQTFFVRCDGFLIARAFHGSTSVPYEDNAARFISLQSGAGVGAPDDSDATDSARARWASALVHAVRNQQYPYDRRAPIHPPGGAWERFLGA